MLNNIDPGEQVKNALIGLARDIRGLAYSFNQKTPYMMFFDWIYPTYSPILIRAVEIWAHDPSVTTPVLKFFGELVQNRSQRLVFDVSSPNGYLLFRETSKLICCYGNRILSIDVPKDQVYQVRSNLYYSRWNRTIYAFIYSVSCFRCASKASPSVFLC